MKNKKNLYKVLSSSVIATMLTVSFGAGIGHAEESSSQPNVETAVTQDSGATTNTVEATTAPTTETIVDTTVTDQTANTESTQSSLLPGDLFYFFKTLTEKIKLALADKDIEKAMLLVQYTQERLNEADALFKNGEEDLAYDTIQKALKLQGLALEYSDDVNVKNDSADTTTADATQGEKVDSETTTDDSTKEETVETEEQENATVEQEESVSSQVEASATVGDSESTELDEVKAQLEEAFTNNVHGLLIAIQNVKNPKALKALTRNLEKQAKKYEMRYGKLLKAEEKYAKVVAEVEEKVETGEISKEEADQKIVKIEQELVKKQQEVKTEVQKDSPKESTTVKEDKTVQNEDVTKDEDQDEDKDENVNKESKYGKKQYKEELKQERKMQREEVKAEKQQMKEERKQEHEKEKHEKKGKDRE